MKRPLIAKGAHGLPPIAATGEEARWALGAVRVAAQIERVAAAAGG